MVRMNFICILPIKMAIVTGGNLINLAAVEKTNEKTCTLQEKIKIKLKKKSLLFFFQYSKNWVGRVGKTKNKKILALMNKN